MRDALWVGPLAVFVGVGTFFAGGGHDGFTPWEWVSVGLAVAACLGLLLGRRAPGLGVLLPGLLAGVYFACGFADGPVYLPFLLGAFVTARRVPVLRWLPWFAASVAALVVGMAVRAATTGLGWWQPLGQSIGVIALAVAAATVGSLLRARRQEQAERVARAATEEQLRMAQDLHDGVGHGLAVIAMQAGVALHVLDRDPDAARRSLEAIRDTSSEALDALRAELSTLAGSGPESGSGSGSGPRTPRRGLADLAGLAERVRATGLAVDVKRSGPEVPPAVDEAAYAIVQEALTNVLRHAGARRVAVDIDAAEALRLTVTDDGRGPSPHADGAGEGMGLRGMRERAEALGGRCSAGPGADGGFAVAVELPL
jgi:signal transduction histidine kinase